MEVYTKSLQKVPFSTQGGSWDSWGSNSREISGGAPNGEQNGGPPLGLCDLSSIQSRQC